ncbi:hypothetical protein V497_03896 [Pseudogymnoascus sp. VKM F-4516 (FW-969)]|nr:hypothetical protein V497_03896 [Pseudogymnoascus sp. VKM F-4516 (FW-969)]
MSPRRGFEEITVKPLGHQSGRDRYPRKYVQDNDIEVPRCAAWGMNLTALSQVYNLYIVAYGSKIHIYKPTGPQQLLTTEPQLILDLPSTPEADRIRATDPYSTHSINHLIVGNLGTHEIILCACADGDVLAYYTSPVHRASLSPTSNPPSPSATPPLTPPQPTPFFHESVEISAWGLAIHSQSRLVAVSSNAHEVQVFAFALTSPLQSPKLDSLLPMPNFPSLSPLPSSPPSRTTNFRLRIPLGARGDNIPSIAFMSTAKGEADSVVASDIRGALWFLPLWGGGERTRVPTTPGGLNWRREPQGWGVCVLDNKFGRRAEEVKEAFGCTPGEIKGVWDISKSITEVLGTRVGARQMMDEVNFFGWGLGATEPINMAEVEGVDLGLYWGDLLDEDGLDEDVDEDFDDDLDDGDDDEEESDASTATSPTSRQHVPVPPHHLILHLNRHALSLYPPTGRPTFCSPILRQDTSHSTAQFSHPMEFYNRLNMVVPVPEMSCVVVGSQVGRVGIMRIMRGGAQEWTGGKYGNSNSAKKTASRVGLTAATMRLEAILPLASQEGRGRERPTTGLHGVAVSPMPEWLPGLESSSSLDGEENGGKRRRGGVKRWRVMLQFWDLSVLSYVLSDERALGVEDF